MDVSIHSDSPDPTQQPCKPSLNESSIERIFSLRPRGRGKTSAPQKGQKTLALTNRSPIKNPQHTHTYVHEEDFTGLMLHNEEVHHLPLVMVTRRCVVAHLATLSVPSSTCTPVCPWRNAATCECVRMRERERVCVCV
jgi:hypothetical protein